jgi:hypothetical protein
MIDLVSEPAISLSEAAASVPPSRQGKRTNISTVLRWILSGVKNPQGERIRLEGIRFGGKWVTSRGALQRFAERLTPDLDAESRAMPRSHISRRRSAERAEKMLDKVGI